MTEVVYDWRRCQVCHQNTYIRAGRPCCTQCIIVRVADCMCEPHADPIVQSREEIDYQEQDQ